MAQGDHTIKIYVMWYVREMRKVITSVLKKGKYKYSYVGKGKEGKGFGGASDAAFYVDFVSQKDFDKIKDAIDKALEKAGWQAGMNYDMYFSEGEQAMSAKTLIERVAAGEDAASVIEACTPLTEDAKSDFRLVQRTFDVFNKTLDRWANRHGDVLGEYSEQVWDEYEGAKDSINTLLYNIQDLL